MFARVSNGNSRIRTWRLKTWRTVCSVHVHKCQITGRRNSWDNVVLSEPSVASSCNRIVPRLRVFYLDTILLLSNLRLRDCHVQLLDILLASMVHYFVRKQWHVLARLCNADGEMFLSWFLKVCITFFMR